MNNDFIRKMSDIETQDVKWLLYPYIPLGKITLVQGNPGEGKTMLLLKIISDLSNGIDTLSSELYGIEKKEIEPINIIYQTAEDGLSDTIKPRLEKFNANCNRIIFIDEKDYPLTMIDERIEIALKETNAKLLVLDPLQAYFGGKVNINLSSDTRPVLSRILKIVEKYNSSLVLIGHLNKNNLGNANQRGMGSMDIFGTARSVLLVGRIRNEPTIRVACQIKSSLAAEGKPFAFKIEDNFEWLGEYEISPEELLNGYSGKNKMQEVKIFIENQFIKNTEIEATIIYEICKEKGFSDRTVNRAKKELGIKSYQKDGKWYWKK